MTLSRNVPRPSTTAERVSFPAQPHAGDPTAPTDPSCLEGRLTYPDDVPPRGGVVLLGPHPHFAGDRDNNVVRGLEAALAPEGWATLAFDYRGIGGSGIDPQLTGAGSVHDYWERVERETRYGEIVDDAEAARAFLARQLRPAGQPLLLHLVGYSFGAILAALLARRREGADDGADGPASLALVAPPIRRFPLPFLAELPLPRLLVLAAGDFLYGPEEIASLRQLPPPRRVEVVEGADHFFRGLEGEAAGRVARFLEHLEPPPSRPPIDPPGDSP